MTFRSVVISAAFQEVPVLVALVGDALGAAPAAHQVDEAVDGPAGSGQHGMHARVQRPDVREVGEVAHQRCDAAAGFARRPPRSGRRSEPTVTTLCPASRRARAAAIPEGPLPPATTTFSARPVLIRRSWRRSGVPAAPVSDVPVMPAVDSMTGRIFFSSAS